MAIDERLKILTDNNVRYIFVDYTGLKEKEMIELIIKHQDLAIQTGLPFIADFNDTYVTTGYMTYAKNFVVATQDIVDKGAFLGVNQVKSFILKAVLLTYGVNYQSFETKDAAIQFITAK